ncbi:glutamine--fructose-6-phosphate transaminase (isomerizing) [Segnochrobactrum spirostomi]|uniref:Glutamine--fructose-6-phosphate aminotransferase [isomerizing] n=1 Tax=Segnochrobactrum spirostomi TaxID=2608987 RepID=A0A6A7XY30_9HYPH|nr:glutamine--fructose-6-phosphate transaminase (isomerizing) [Segnochrobactrum spirostomi]MQT11273.1 glutamine--fructose-6-phosphate transaminase (isomerizing) [Segnochrobactrum spirostomi]
MCGIVGILGNAPVAERLIDSLKRLEYRGYDSAGIATLEGGRLTRLRAAGKLKNLEAEAAAHPLAGVIGIGHTRWATHGGPTERNAHPHVAGRVAVVHNGIIENFRELKDALIAGGAVFESDTDTEVIAHLLSVALAAGETPQDALAKTLKRLRGAFALAILIEGEEDLLLAARRGSPLAVGLGKGETYLGSDAIALAPFTNRIVYLEEGDWAVLDRKGVTIFDAEDRPVARPLKVLQSSALLVEKGNYRHFMAKEIAEQPDVIGHTLAYYLDLAEGRAKAPEGLDFAAVERVSIAACGTAYYAGLVGKYWFERLARLPVDIDVASEFRYREVPLKPGGLSIFISQSGETADTLASLRYCREAGQRIAAVVNVPTSTIARESDVVLPTLAGPEIGVASTKAFTCQLSVLASLAVAAARARGTIDAAEEKRLVEALAEVPRLVSQALALEHEIAEIGRRIHKASDVLYLGRGTSYPIALEGALKLKELSYIHAEGYAAGELKHGPIALIDESVPVVVVAPFDSLFEKTASNMQEVAARGGRIILVTDEEGLAHAGLTPAETILLPKMPPEIAPIVYAIPVQFLAYHTAVVNGTDVDQPRNLAKSVTVE